MKEDGFRFLFDSLVLDSITNYDETGDVSTTPERRCWAAVLVRAIFDYVNPPKNNHKIFAEAYAYLFDDTDEFRSPLWICQLISNNPAKLLDDIRKGVKELKENPK